LLFVFLAMEPRLGLAPDHADIENADGKTLAAVAATHGIAKDHEGSQIFKVQTRGA
jgi:hypothetical protein